MNSRLAASLDWMMKSIGRLFARAQDLFTWLLRKEWLFAFTLGFAAVTCFLYAASLWPGFHDRVLMPALCRGLLSFPNRWLISGILVLLTLLRADSVSRWRLVPAALLGGWEGVMVVWDWWYHAPFLVAFLLAMTAWRIRWLFWSHPVWVVGTTFTLVFLALSGAFWDLGWPPQWDNRLGFGLPHPANRTVTLAFLVAGGALLLVWGGRHLLKAGARHRQLLTDLIERDPRAKANFQATARLTHLRIPGNPPKAGRFAAAAKNLVDDRGTEGSAIWHSWQHSWVALRGAFRRAFKPRLGGGKELEGVYADRVLFRPVLDFLWAFGYLASVLPPAVHVSRWFRAPLFKPGFPSFALRRLLKEGVTRQHGAWCAAWLSPGGDAPAELFARLRLRTDEERQQDQERADRAFARYVLLREAQIEAEVYFGLMPPSVGAEDAEAYLKRFQALAGTRAPGGNQDLAQGSAAPATASPARSNEDSWQRAAIEYEALWIENCDRVFMTRVEAFGLPFFERTQIQDLQGLILRLTASGSAASPIGGQVLQLLEQEAPDVVRRLPQPGQAPEEPETLRRLLAGALNLVLRTTALNQEPILQRLKLPEEVIAQGTLLRREMARGFECRGLLVRHNRQLLEAAFGRTVAPARDPVDLAALSCSWLACRRAGWSQPPSIHRAAADLALCLFLVDPVNPGLAETISQELRKQYFDPHRMLGSQAPLARQLAAQDFREAGLCAVLYGLWQGGQANWIEGSMPLTLSFGNPAHSSEVHALVPFQGDRFAQQSPHVLRAAAHIDAANLRCRHGGHPEVLAQVGVDRGGGSWLDRILGHYRQLDTHPESRDLLFDGRCPGEVLACVFADHLLRCEPEPSAG
jgi:hypothetical protein